MDKHDGKTTYGEWAKTVLGVIARTEGSADDKLDERAYWLCSWAALESCYVLNNPLGAAGRRPFGTLEEGAEALVSELRQSGPIARILSDEAAGFLDFKTAVAQDPRSRGRHREYVLHPPAVGKDWSWRPMIVWDGHPNP